MKFLRGALDKAAPNFEKGGKFEKMYPLFEAMDTFMFTPPDTTKGSTHVRDGIDLKRLMITVAVALIPTILMALYNTGYQANLALVSMGAESAGGWRGWVIDLVGLGYDPGNILACALHGALYFLPIFLAVNVMGGIIEVTFASIRGHEVNEGFLVTGMLLPLIMPPDIPLWQAMLGTAFGVIFGKEIFGGTGKNFLNPALTGRAFLYFAYPAQISGDAVWTAAPDGFTGATALGVAAADGMAPVLEQMTWMEAFLGRIPGSMGETSVLACLIGAVILIASGIGSWRIMLAVLVGALGSAWGLNLIGSETNPMFQMGPEWHLVLGGLAFGTVFMATDPVSAAFTDTGKIVYGLLVGFLTTLIRVINPAFPEGVMLAILFGNVFAPVIDYYVVRSNIKKRVARYV